MGRFAEIMVALGCKHAERLLWAYLGALGESGKAHSAFVHAIHTGPTNLINEMSKKLKLTVAAVSHARAAFQQHSQEHGCCSDPVTSPPPLPPPTRATPSYRKPSRR